MRWFADNDILLKLASYDLLDETLRALECTRGSIYVLRSAPYFFRRSGKLIQRGTSPTAILKAGKFSKDCLTVPNPSASVLSRFQATTLIDPGEAILFAAGSADRNVRLLTDDKRALRGLYQCQELYDIYKALSGRCISLCVLLYSIIQNGDFNSIKQKIRRGKPCDMAIDGVFAASALTEQKALASIQLQIDNLKKLTGSLLGSL
jgi:hypothetical protein